MRWIQIEQSGPLRGTVSVPGSKNSALALLIAACLADEPIALQGIPDLQDFSVIYRLFHDIGMKVERGPQRVLRLDPRGIRGADLDRAKTSSFRASYYFVGALLAKHRTVKIGYPGGDDFVSRPIDQHFKVFKALGAKVELFDTYYSITAEKLSGADIFFDVVTSGATINALLAASLACGTTRLRNAAIDPEVVDTANFLNAMGAKIRGAGTPEVRIEGVRQLGDCAHAVIPDRLIAGTFLLAAAATRGEIAVDGVVPAHLSSLLAKMEEIGVPLDVRESRITAYGDVPLRAARVRTGMYPGFATDLQQPLTPVLLRAAGKSIITEKVYPKRFHHVSQLRRLGADIALRGATAYVRGQARLTGGYVHASDVRAGVALLLAGLMAEGTTRVDGVEHVERGYENIAGMFAALGARMRLIDEEETAGEAVDVCGRTAGENH